MLFKCCLPSNIADCNMETESVETQETKLNLTWEKDY